MKLYRYLSKEELEQLLNMEYSMIGTENVNKPYYRYNSHRYKENVKYLHFYFDEKEISRIKKMSFHKKAEYYICEFEIPFYVIFSHIGVGYYANKKGEKKTDYVYEVALPTYKMRPKFLKSFRSLTEEKKHELFLRKNKQENNIEQEVEPNY